MESTTKSQINRSSIEKICKRIFGESTVISQITELTDGCYNASYRVHVDSEDTDIILKAAPSDFVDILTYEKDIMKTEVELYKKVKEETLIPIPRVLDHNFHRDIVEVPYFISERLFGVPLNKIESVSKEARKALYCQMAKYLAYLHRIKGTYFGYPNWTEKKATYKEAFRDMVVQVLLDGEKKKASFPMDVGLFQEVFDGYLYVFDEMVDPVLVHFDLWDGNVFVKDMDTNPTIEGLIDFERSFYGDRLADFVQASFYIDLEKDHYFLDIYNSYADAKVIYDQTAQLKILLHKIYLFIIMIVESKYRDVNGSYDGQLGWASKEFLNLFEQLKGFPK